MSDDAKWIAVCDADAIDPEDVIPFDFGGAHYAIYRTPSGYYATDGYCTHAAASLADGFVMGDIIECPFHNGRFHIPTGTAKSPPVSVDLKTYPVRLEDGKILVQLPE